MTTRRDVRPWALLGATLLIAMLGLLIRCLPGSGAAPSVIQSRAFSPRVAPALPEGTSAAPPPTLRSSARDARPVDTRTAVHRDVLHERFQQAVAMLHARRYDYAVAALHEVLRLAPALPEAHVNMGFALLGLGRPRAAEDFFNAAIDLRASQVNAYWGLAVALEQRDDLRGALGAMRTFVHLSRAEDPYLPRARAALWEWEAALAQRAPAHEEAARGSSGGR